MTNAWSSLINYFSSCFDRAFYKWQGIEILLFIIFCSPHLWSDMTVKVTVTESKLRRESLGVGGATINDACVGHLLCHETCFFFCFNSAKISSSNNPPIYFFWLWSYSPMYSNLFRSPFWDWCESEVTWKWLIMTSQPKLCKNCHRPNAFNQSTLSCGAAALKMGPRLLQQHF